jgi:hypothetical protein
VSSSYAEKRSMYAHEIAVVKCCMRITGNPDSTIGFGANGLKSIFRLVGAKSRCVRISCYEDYDIVTYLLDVSNPY